MKAIALFNNTGGVGKTTIAYHLGFMFSELGHRVVFADLDPHANLSAMCLTEERLEAIWNLKPRPTIHGAIEGLRRGTRDVDAVALEELTARLGLITGDLQLAELEEDLSQAWPRCLLGDARAFRVTTALHRVVAEAGERFGADVAVLDVGPNLGALNRAALMAADHVVIPVAPDLFSLQGLQTVGPQLAAWREQWQERRARAPELELELELPAGQMQPLGYVVARIPVFAGGALKAFQRWIDRVPSAYREAFGAPGPEVPDLATDDACLAQLKDYRSLMPMAQEAKKPMFLLKPADGAIGGHQRAVLEAFADFRHLAEVIIERVGGR